MTRTRHKAFLRLGYFGLIGWILSLVIRFNLTEAIAAQFGTPGMIAIIALVSVTGLMAAVFLMFLGLLPIIYTRIYNSRSGGFLKSMMEPYRFLLLEDDQA